MALEGMKARMAYEKERNKEFKKTQKLTFYRDFQNKLVNRADASAGRLIYLNGKLSYNPGTQGNVSKIALWNEFQTLANKKEIAVDKEFFDAVHQEFVTQKNQNWFNAYEYALSSGADPDDLKELFKTNPGYRQDFLEVQNSLPMDESGQYYRGIMGETQPTGEEMRGEGWVSGLGDFAKEHPLMATGAAAGTYYGAKKFGPGLLSRIGGMGTGGIPAAGGWPAGGKFGTFLKGATPAFTGQLAGMGLGMFGMDEKTAGLAGAGIGGGLTGRHMYKTLNPLYSSGVKKELSKSLVKGGKAAILKNARALGVDKKVITNAQKGLKGSQTLAKKAIKNKVATTSSKVLMQDLTRGYSKKIGVSQATKAGARFAGKQAIKKAGLMGLGPIGWLAGLGWTAYDIYNLLNPKQSAQTSAPKRAKHY